MTAQPVLRTRGLRRSYKSGTQNVEVLHGIDLDLAKGSHVAIMGPSGSGKSTLLQILGLLDRPTSGELWLEGRETSRLDEADLAHWRGRQIGFVFQAFHLLPRLTLYENVELPLLYLGVSRRERRQRVDEALELLGIADRGHHLPSQVSGGQKQRAAIARAIVKKPGLLLADEPTGNLDSHTTHEVLEIFDEMNRMGQTVLVITHDSAVASRAREIWTILDGNLHCGKAQ